MSDNSTENKQLITTQDPVMQELLRQVLTASKNQSSVIIYGESGTGKELIARALHQLGNRAKGPFVAINCAAFPETLLESELFGHSKGAFTDAKSDKVGHIVRATGGTLFLDEIGDAPLSIQVRLLRVIQEREVTPLGASAPVKIDVRFVAATHRNLKEQVALGAFREDLYYRLNVLSLRVPPLRERSRDILHLAELFANKVLSDNGSRFAGFSDATKEALLAYKWPGNVRELENRVERAVLMSQGRMIQVSDLFPPEETVVSVKTNPANHPTTLQLVHSSNQLDNTHAVIPYRKAKEAFEKQYIEQLIKATNGNVSQAARLAEKSRPEIYALMKRHGIGIKKKSAA